MMRACADILTHTHTHRIDRYSPAASVT